MFVAFAMEQTEDWADVDHIMMVKMMMLMMLKVDKADGWTDAWMDGLA